MSESWRALAACREVGWELPFGSDGEQRAFADTVCRRCPVRAECLDFAMFAERHAPTVRHGVFGGYTGPERTLIGKDESLPCVDCGIGVVPSRYGDRCRPCFGGRQSERYRERWESLVEAARQERGAA